MDMAISIKACIDKNGYMSKIKGDTNILVFPDFEASNMSWRLVKYLKNHMAAMLLGVLLNLLL
jgi:phosphotransacetylase